jgi:hypothetical protein
MLHKEERNKMIKVHRLEWVADRILREDTKEEIKIHNRWASTDSLSHSKWAHTSNLGIMGKCTADRFQECPHHLRI